MTALWTLSFPSETALFNKVCAHPYVVSAGIAQAKILEIAVKNLANRQVVALDIQPMVKKLLKKPEYVIKGIECSIEIRMLSHEVAHAFFDCAFFEERIKTPVLVN